MDKQIPCRSYHNLEFQFPLLAFLFCLLNRKREDVVTDQKRWHVVIMHKVYPYRHSVLALGLAWMCLFFFAFF